MRFEFSKIFGFEVLKVGHEEMKGTYRLSCCYFKEDLVKNYCVVYHW